MPFKDGDKLGEHVVVANLLEDPDAPRTNFGYRQWDIEVGTTLGAAEGVAPDTEGAQEVWVHVNGSPAGTSNVAWLKSAKVLSTPLGG